MFDLTGRVALVTGAGQNVGAGIACALAGQGAALAVNDFHADRALRIAEEINQAGGQAVAIPFDVTDLAAVTAGFDEATARLGLVDVLVNNAGTGGPTEPMPMAKFADMGPEKWAPIIAVNLFGPMELRQSGDTIDDRPAVGTDHHHLLRRWPNRHEHRRVPLCRR